MAHELKHLIAERLKKIVHAHVPKIEKGLHQAKKLAVTISKGGVGKTTTAVSLACALAKYQHQKVLLVDLDPQGHVGAYLNDQPQTPVAFVSQLLTDSKQHSRELIEAVFKTHLPNLYLTLPDKNLLDAEHILSSKMGKEFILKSLLEITVTHFDWIIFDCPPHIGNLTLNALMASDYVLIPTDLTVLSLEGVGDILSTIDTLAMRLQHRLQVLGILPTRVDSRTKRLNQTMYSTLKELYGPYVLDYEIPMSSVVSRAQLKSCDVFSYDSESLVAQAYQQVALALMQKTEKN